MQLDLFTYTAPTSYPYTAPPARPALVIQEDEPDEEQASTGQLSAGQLAQVDYQNICRLALIGQTEYCHNCALFQSASRQASGSISITCKVLSYVDYDGNLSPGYGLTPGCTGRDITTRPQWVKEIYLANTIRERRARLVAYKA